MNVVILFRKRPSEPEASDQAFKAQQDSAAAWVAEHGATVLATFTQAEADGEAPRQLWAALAVCRKRDAALLVAMTDPIGTGHGFASRSYYGGVPCHMITHALPEPPPPRTPGVPEPVAPERAPPPAPVPLPAGAPDRLCLCFDPSGFPKLPVHLCNPGPGPIRDVVVTSAGTTTQWTQTVTVGESNEARTVEVPLQTSTARRSFEAIEPGTCIQVDRYDVFFDGDFVTIYEVAYTDACGIQRRGRAIVDKGGPSSRWLTFSESDHKGVRGPSCAFAETLKSR